MTAFEFGDLRVRTPRKGSTPFPPGPGNGSRHLSFRRAVRSDEHTTAVEHRRDQKPTAKIHSLPADKLVELEDFMDFPHPAPGEAPARTSRDRRFGSIREVWNNPDDAAYDRM
jgi:hypothetical protein